MCFSTFLKMNFCVEITNFKKLVDIIKNCVYHISIMSAMEVLETVAENNIPHKHPLTAMIWTNEEGSLVHGMSRPIGALFHVPHGMSNAMLLEKCMTFAKDGALDRFSELARAIGLADDKTDNKTASESFTKALV